MSSRILRAADVAIVPWKNGMGRTRELAVHPARASAADFLWRASIADVDSAAPFSSFPGIDRQIALLDGAGFIMHLDHVQRHALTEPYAFFPFAGEADVDVELVDGPTRDFNLMLRRGKVHGRVAVLRGAGKYHVDASAVLVHDVRGSCATADGVLEAGDSWLEPVAGSVLVLDEVGIALMVLVESERDLVRQGDHLLG
ncbi:HutD family protein [Dyella sp.]|uniref:HutD/Ves family protein n=1 Tax=Dyella sp. TaxID=1869338 RepID=UPI002ECFDA3F